MKIEVTSNEVDEFSGVSRNTGKPFQIRKQQAWGHLPGQPYPQLISIPLGRDQAPYQPGVYELAQESFVVNKYQELGLRPVLKKSA